MNRLTKKSHEPFHIVMVSKREESVILCVDNSQGQGGYDYWYVDELGHRRTNGIEGKFFMNYYWQDSVLLETLQNVYKVLEFYSEYDRLKEESEESWPMENEGVSAVAGDNFTADDIPF